VLKPTLPGKSIVGPALTVRNIRQRSDPLNAATHVNRMAEFEAHNLAEDGDVLVISGVSGMSNMGGISSMTGKRQGERGAIVMGGVRDVRHSRSIDYPVWASEITPVTGKWRLETMEINGEIQMGNVRVSPGDLVIADDTGGSASSRAPTSCACWNSARRKRKPKTPASKRSRRASLSRSSTPKADKSPL
jgi:4-hydroxy-4-methyl-2-oxoglutarate aldolase